MSERGDQLLAERPNNPYYAVIDKTLEAFNVNPEDVADFLGDHPLGSRVAADAVTVGRYFAGRWVLEQYDQAIKDGDTKRGLVCVGGLGVILGTDFIDGYVANTAGIGGSKHGAALDSISDVALRLEIAKRIVGKEHKALDALRMGGEGLVLGRSAPDLLHGEYKATTIGKVKVNFDALFVLSELTAGAVKAGEPEKHQQLLNQIERASITGRIGGLALAYADGAYRWGKWYANKKAGER